MGVDYSVVSGYGCEIENVDNEYLESIESQLRKRGYGVIEAGSACYGGKKLLAFVAKERSLNPRESPGGWYVQPGDAPTFDVAVAAEFKLVVKGPIGWLCGLRVW